MTRFAYLFGIFCLGPFSLGQEQPVDPFADLKPTVVKKEKVDPDELITRSWIVPPSFLGVGKTKTAREVLESAGISFPEGTKAIYKPASGILIVRNTRDQIELVEAYGCFHPRSPEKLVHGIFEYIEMESKLYHDWISQNQISHAGSNLRKTVQEWVRSGRATIVDTIVVTAQPGDRAKSESVHELICATIKKEKKDLKTNPFEVLKTGTTIEMDVVIGPLNLEIDIYHHSEVISPLEDFPKTVGSIRLHHMVTNNRASIRVGTYLLAGTHRPPKSNGGKFRDPLVLQFIRVDIAELPPQKLSDEFPPRKPDLATRKYSVPSELPTQLGWSPYDGGKPDIKKLLVKSGLPLDKDSLVTFDKSSALLTITCSEDNVEILEHILESVRNQVAPQIHALQEWIEVDHDLFSNWLYENQMTTDGTALRDQVRKWIGEGRAIIVESILNTSRPGDRALANSESVLAHPLGMTEPPKGIELVRKTGISHEIDPLLGPDSKTVNLNLAPEIAVLDQSPRWDKLIGNRRLPIVHYQKITTQVVVHDGRHAFLGTTRPLTPANPKITSNPLTLQFVRTDVSSSNDWKRIED